MWARPFQIENGCVSGSHKDKGKVPVVPKRMSKTFPWEDVTGPGAFSVFQSWHLEEGSNWIKGRVARSSQTMSSQRLFPPRKSELKGVQPVFHGIKQGEYSRDSGMHRHFQDTPWESVREGRSSSFVTWSLRLGFEGRALGRLSLDWIQGCSGDAGQRTRDHDTTARGEHGLFHILPV